MNFKIDKKLLCLKIVATGVFLFSFGLVNSVEAISVHPTQPGFKLPFESGTSVYLSTTWLGNNGDPASHHDGVGKYDFAWGGAGMEGIPVLAVADGYVEQRPDGEIPGFGEAIQLKFDNGTEARYAHLSSYEGGERDVEQGEVIGYVGSTGNSSGPHLHFEYASSSVWSDRYIAVFEEVKSKYPSGNGSPSATQDPYLSENGTLDPCTDVLSPYLDWTPSFDCLLAANKDGNDNKIPTQYTINNLITAGKKLQVDDKVTLNVNGYVRNVGGHLEMLGDSKLDVNGYVIGWANAKFAFRDDSYMETGNRFTTSNATVRVLDSAVIDITTKYGSANGDTLFDKGTTMITPQVAVSGGIAEISGKLVHTDLLNVYNNSQLILGGDGWYSTSGDGLDSELNGQIGEFRLSDSDLIIKTKDGFTDNGFLDIDYGYRLDVIDGGDLYTVADFQVSGVDINVGEGSTFDARKDLDLVGGSLMTIESGGELKIDNHNHGLLVKNGSGVLVKGGGSLVTGS